MAFQVHATNEQRESDALALLIEHYGTAKEVDLSWETYSLKQTQKLQAEHRNDERTQQNLSDLMRQLQAMPVISPINIGFLQIDESVTAPISSIPTHDDIYFNDENQSLDFWHRYRCLAHDQRVLESAPRKLFTLMIQHLVKFVVTPQICLDLYTAIIRDMASVGLELNSLEWRLVFVSFFRCGFLHDYEKVLKQPKKWMRLLTSDQQKHPTRFGGHGKEMSHLYYDELLSIYIRQENETAIVTSLEHLGAVGLLESTLEGVLIQFKLSGNLEMSFKAIEIAQKYKVQTTKWVELVMYTFETKLNDVSPETLHIPTDQVDPDDLFSRGRRTAFKVSNLPYSAQMKTFLSYIDPTIQSLETLEKLLHLCRVYRQLAPAHKIWRSISNLETNSNPNYKLTNPHLEVANLAIITSNPIPDFVSLNISNAALATPSHLSTMAYIDVLLAFKQDRAADNIFKRIIFTSPGHHLSKRRNIKFQYPPPIKLELRNSPTSMLCFLELLVKNKRMKMVDSQLIISNDMRMRILNGTPEGPFSIGARQVFKRIKSFARLIL